MGTRAFSSSTPFRLSTLALRCKRKHERHGGAALSPALDLDAAAPAAAARSYIPSTPREVTPHTTATASGLERQPSPVRER